MISDVLFEAVETIKRYQARPNYQVNLRRRHTRRNRRSCCRYGQLARQAGQGGSCCCYGHLARQAGQGAGTLLRIIIRQSPNYLPGGRIATAVVLRQAQKQAFLSSAESKARPDRRAVPLVVLALC